jgi:hypothetical protein
MNRNKYCMFSSIYRNLKCWSQAGGVAQWYSVPFWVLYSVLQKKSCLKLKIVEQWLLEARKGKEGKYRWKLKNGYQYIVRKEE